MNTLNNTTNKIESRQNDVGHILVIDQLTKKFGKFTAVDNISFSVNRGEIFGFLGPNGAGKTTTIKMIAGLLQPDKGQISINNRSLAREPPKMQAGYRLYT